MSARASLWQDADRLLEDVASELTKARERFAPFNSPHEGWAVIREELDELWDNVKANTACTLDGRREAIQIAAMAMRFALDCPPTARSEQDDVDSALARLEAANRV
jgi:hypothetical protein